MRLHIGQSGWGVHLIQYKTAYMFGQDNTMIVTNSYLGSSDVSFWANYGGGDISVFPWTLQGGGDIRVFPGKLQGGRGDISVFPWTLQGAISVFRGVHLNFFEFFPLLCMKAWNQLWQRHSNNSCCLCKCFVCFAFE